MSIGGGSFNFPSRELTIDHVFTMVTYSLWGEDSQESIGNEFTPKGPPDLANGSPTTHGVFIVPLDEFRKIFKGLHYETAKPLRK